MAKVTSMRPYEMEGALQEAASYLQEMYNNGDIHVRAEARHLADILGIELEEDGDAL